MTHLPKPKDPVRLVADLVRHLANGESYTIARASVAVHDGETSTSVARKLREATVRDLRRSNRDEHDSFFEGVGALVENEASFAIGETIAGRSIELIHIVDGHPIPGTRFKWMRSGEERIVFVAIRVITREEQAKTKAFLEDLAA